MNKKVPQSVENSAPRKWNGYSHSEALGWLLTDNSISEKLCCMGKQARVRGLRKFIKDHAKANNTTPENVAATIRAADKSSGNRSTDEKLAVWYFIKKGILQ